MSEETSKGWFAVMIECDRQLTALDISDALYEQFELRPGFTATVVKVREDTHSRLLTKAEHDELAPPDRSRSAYHNPPPKETA